jgi:hypothetical protein
MLNVRRRQFITLVGGAAAWPTQQAGMPVVEFLDGQSLSGAPRPQS